MKRYFIFLFYVAVSLMIGREFHPFSTFPMYDSFPNWGYVFFLKNEKGEVIPYGKNLRDGKTKNAGYVGHTFYSYMQQNHFTYGDGKEDSSQLHSVGRTLMEMILQGESNESFKFDTLRLYRRYYYLRNEQLDYRDDMIYEQALRP